MKPELGRKRGEKKENPGWNTQVHRQEAGGRKQGELRLDPRAEEGAEPVSPLAGGGSGAARWLREHSGRGARACGDSLA